MSGIIPFDHSPVTGGAQAMPAALAALFEGRDPNIIQHSSVPTLRFKGKVWSIDKDGQATNLTKVDEDGNRVPIQIIKVVVLDVNKNRSRSYYEGKFVEGTVNAPKCYSRDGITPDASVKEPMCSSCKLCPMAAKGSEISEDGKQLTACKQIRRIAVAPSASVDQVGALLLRLPATSLWAPDDKENEAQGWFAFDSYLKYLADRGCQFVESVETMVKFATDAYPRLLFKASGWLDTDKLRGVLAYKDANKDLLDSILNGAKGEEGAAAEPDAAPAPKAEAKPAATKAKPKAEPKPAVEEATEEPVVEKPAPKAKAKPAPVVVEEEPAVEAPVTKPAAKAVSSDAPKSVDDLLAGGWDD